MLATERGAKVLSHALGELGKVTMSSCQGYLTEGLLTYAFIFLLGLFHHLRCQGALAVIFGQY